MKAVIITVIIALALGALFLSSCGKQSEAFDIAIAFSADRNINRKCEPFAIDLSERLNKAGFKNLIAWFVYQNHDGVWGAHACVIYQDPAYNAKYPVWLMDYKMEKPVWLPTKWSMKEQVERSYPSTKYLYIYQWKDEAGVLRKGPDAIPSAYRGPLTATGPAK